MFIKMFTMLSSARERDFERTTVNFEDAPRESGIVFKIFRTLRTGAQFHSKCSGCSARERDFFKIFRMFRKGVRFSSI